MAEIYDFSAAKRKKQEQGKNKNGGHKGDTKDTDASEIIKNLAKAFEKGNAEERIEIINTVTKLEPIISKIGKLDCSSHSFQRMMDHTSSMSVKELLGELERATELEIVKKPAYYKAICRRLNSKIYE